MEQKKILLIDDDQDLTLILSVMLSSKNYNVKIANSKTEGRQILSAFKPDLLILDVNMETEFAGFDLNREIRLNPEFNELPILMLTGIDVLNTSDQMVDMYLEMAGMPEFNENKVIKVKGADGTVAIDYKTGSGVSYWLPLDGFLSKPVEEEELLAAINELLR